MSVRHSLPPLCEESYSADRYVQRVKLEQAINQWLRDPKADRTPILSLIGPPGSGKSWLLARIPQMPETKDAPVLHLNADQLIDFEQHDEIKRKIIEKANAACPNLNYPQDMLPSLSALVTDITERLCARCTGQRFLVLIDGCDDLASQEEFDTLQRTSLRPFFDTQARCIRMIIARRLQLTDYTLRKLSLSLLVGVFENDQETNTHRDKLSTQLQSSAAEWPELPIGCKYRWNHPYINCYLMQSSQDGVITTQTLANCCRAVIKRSMSGTPTGRQPTVDVDLRILAQMTQEHADGWTSSNFRTKIRKDLDDAYLRRGLVIARKADDAMSGPTYRVIDGLCELLAALPGKEL